MSEELVKISNCAKLWRNDAALTVLQLGNRDQNEHKLFSLKVLTALLICKSDSFENAYYIYIYMHFITLFWIV